jgi:hypothetical protein
MATQWFCSFLLCDNIPDCLSPRKVLLTILGSMIFFLVTRTKALISQPLSDDIPGYSMSTQTIALFTLLPSMLLFTTASYTLLTKDADPDDDLSGCWRQLLLAWISSYVYTLIDFTLSITHFVPQLVAILRTKSGQELSILSLGLEIPTLLLLAFAMGERFEHGVRRRRRRRPEDEELGRGYLVLVYKLWRRGPFEIKEACIWYLSGGNVAFVYAIMGLGRAVLFAMCLVYRNGDGLSTKENL